MNGKFERRRGFSRLVAATLLALGGVCGQGAFGEDVPSGYAADFKIVPPLAWNRADKYEPPDFEAFFPDDVEAGKQLDEWLAGKLTLAGVDERLALVRRGLRNTSRHRTELLGSVGNQFIWNCDPQDARAIELMYHASASDDDEVAYYALYHGPTVVSERTPNLVRMLMERYQSLDGQMQQRIAWGMKTYGEREQTRKLLVELLDDYKNLDAGTVAATLDTYQAVFDEQPPAMDRFEAIGLWVIAFHRTDLSADHPRAAEILREALEVPLRGRPQRLVDFVTRVVEGHEVAVALVQGAGVRDELITYLSERPKYRVDLNELLSARVLRECRLREFARHLPEGLPKHALPAYTRPPADATHAYDADEFVAPSYDEFFPDDAAAGAELDNVYGSGDRIELSDGQLLDLFRRGVRRSAHTPNMMFGWISGSLGWPPDPRLTEILYQAIDPRAPLAVRKAGIYYGFGLGTTRTKNVLEAMFRVYMAPPFDRGTNGNMRSRILWSVGDHEDDKRYLADRFAEVLEDHAALSDEAIHLADSAYRQLTGAEPPNPAEYATRGVYLVVFGDTSSHTVEESKRRFNSVLGAAEQVIETKFVAEDGRITVIAAVRGAAGMKKLVERLQNEPGATLYVADLLTRELVDGAEEPKAAHSTNSSGTCRRNRQSGSNPETVTCPGCRRRVQGRR